MDILSARCSIGTAAPTVKFTEFSLGTFAGGRYEERVRPKTSITRAIFAVPSMAGWSALALAAISSAIDLTIRDALSVTAVIHFGTPWLVRSGLLAFGWLIVRPVSSAVRLVSLGVAVHCVIQCGHSFRGDSVDVDSRAPLEITLWNAGRNLWKMPREWPNLANQDTRLAVFIEAGPFPDDSWQRFTSVHRDLIWKRLDGGVVIGVRGKIKGCDSLGTGQRFRCHRLRLDLDGMDYTIIAVDIPSQPWLARSPMLDRILAGAPSERCLILGDFNTPETARGFSPWVAKGFHLANTSHSGIFRETWPYGIPVLTLDQLWLSPDLRGNVVRSRATLRSDHSRITFAAGP